MNACRRKTVTAEQSGIYFSVLVLAIVVANVTFSLIFETVYGSSSSEFLNSAAYKYISYSFASVVICIVSAAFIAVSGLDVKNSFALKKTEPIYYGMAVLALFAAFFGLSGVNGYFIEFLENCFGYEYTATELPEFTAANFAATVLTVCALPAFFEEAAFRGIMASGLKGIKIIPASLIGGLCFSLFHMNPAQTPYQFAVGFVFSVLALTSGSVFPSVVAHFFNNFIIVCISYFCGDFVFDGVLGACLTVAGLIALIAFIALCLKKTKIECVTDEKVGGTLNFIVYAAFGIIVCAVIWASGLL